MAQLNVDCDILAKIGVQRYHKECNTPPEALLHIFVRVKIAGVKFTSNMNKDLRNESSRRSMRSCLDSKQVLTGSTFDMVDWDAVKH